MAFEPEFLELMPDTVTLRHPDDAGATDVFGRTQFDPFEPVQTFPNARVEWRTVLARGPDGGSVSARGRVFLPGEVAVVLRKTVVTLPGGETPVLVAADVVRDEDGPHHTVLAFE